MNHAEKMIMQCITELIIHRAVENKFKPIDKFVNLEQIMSNLNSSLTSDFVNKILKKLVNGGYLNVRKNGKGYLNTYYLKIKGFKEWDKVNDYLVRDYTMYE